MCHLFIKIKNSRRSYSISKHRSQPESQCFRNAYICVFNYTSIVWEIHYHRRTPVLTSYCMTTRTSILCENLYTIGVSLNQRGVHPQLNNFGRGDKNRTRISGFGDRCTAIVLHPYNCA